MKISKKVLTVLLCLLMIMSTVSFAFAAADYRGKTNSGDITLSSKDDIDGTAIFTGTVTIPSGCTVSDGVFKGNVINNGTISGGTFNGNVENNASGIGSGITGGTFTGTVNNNGAIKGGTFKGTVNNNSAGKISKPVIYCPSFYCNVTNYGEISGGSFGAIINNSGTVGSGVDAIINNSGTYTVQHSPSVYGTATITSGSSFTVPKSSTVTVSDGGSLTIGVNTVLNGKITVNDKGSLKLNGDMDSSSQGEIRINEGGSLSGSKTGQFAARTYKQYTVTVNSNVELKYFNVTLNSMYTSPMKLYNGDSISYSIDYQATNTGCVVVNSVTLYKGRKLESNKIETLTGTKGTFANYMPQSDVIVYIDATVNHTSTHEVVNPTCTTPGLDREYCSICNHTIEVKELKALGHNYTAWVRNTDPNKKLLKSRTCQREGCNDVDNAYIEIKGYDNQSVEVDYKSTCTFSYNVKLPDGAYVMWKYNDGSPFAANGSYTVNKAESSYTVTAIVMGSVNDSYEVKVNVKNGFWDKFVAFFRGLFNALPVYVDNVKQ